MYWESLTTSLREVRRNLRGIVMLSTVLVIATATAVAAVAHAFHLGWGLTWVLGAALAPTDATAVGVLAAALPRRDVTALVDHRLAVGATTSSQHLTRPRITWLFLLAYAGGAALGAAVAAAGTAPTPDRPVPAWPGTGAAPPVAPTDPGCPGSRTRCPPPLGVRYSAAR
ncbi:hypothetical protein [Actinomadura rugatobispora]|uniref:Cation/H+ exchanger domain-containing protein n=1 Tax=Actinomadura rugatobispora TaxID=1994 RepID=A0ABW0ZQ96_9ACTN